MKVYKITDTAWEYVVARFDARPKVFAFVQPVAASALKNFADTLKKDLTADANETFLIICDEFGGTAFDEAEKILRELGLENRTLMLFNLRRSAVKEICRLKDVRTLDFFRAVYDETEHYFYELTA